MKVDKQNMVMKVNISPRWFFIAILVALLLVFQFLIEGCNKQEGVSPESQPQAIEKARFEEVGLIFKPLDIFLILDQSGSMLKTDPFSLRISASRFFLSYLSVYASKTQEHRAGVIGFGSNAPLEQVHPLISVLSQAEALKNAIQPKNLNHTNFLAAFQQAAEQFQSDTMPAGQRQRALVIFTDGRPDLGDGTPPENLFYQMEEFVQKKFAPKDILLFVVAIDQKGEYWFKDKPFWDRMAEATYQITSMEGLDRVFHEILIRLVGGDSEHLTPPRPSQPIKVNVEPYLERLSFLLLKKEPQTTVSITQPNGQKVLPKTEGAVSYDSGGKEGRFEIYSIADPQPGEWTIELVGTGTIEVFKDALRLNAILLNPSSPYPQGSPMNIEVKLMHRDGRKVLPIAGYPLRLSAAIEFPNKKREFVGFQEREASLFVSEQTVPITEAGRYIVTLSLKGGEITVYQQTFPIDVGPFPYLLLEELKDGAVYPIKRHLTLQGRLMRNQQPILAQEVFDEEPGGVAIMRLVSPTEDNKHFADFLKEQKQEGASVFFHELPYCEKEGAYQIELRLAGRLKDGTDYRSVIERVRFLKTKILWDRWADNWKLLLTFVVILGSVVFVMWLRLPSLTGQINVSNRLSTQPQAVFLRGKRFRLRRGHLVTTEGGAMPHGYFVAQRERTPTNEIAVKVLYCEYKGTRAFIGKARWILRAAIGILVAVAIVMAFRYDMRLGIGVVSIVVGFLCLWGMFWNKIERGSSIEMSPGVPTMVGDWTVIYRQ